MFVSPPPASLTSQVLLQRKSSRKNGHHNHHSVHNNTLDTNSTITKEDTSSSLYHVTSNESGSSQHSRSSTHSTGSQESRKDADFINTPPEYSNRARVEIRKRLLTSTGNGSIPHGPNSKINKTYSHSSDNNISLSRASTTRTSIDDSSLISDRASSIFSHTSTINTNSTTFTNASSIFNPTSNKRPHYITETSLEDALPKTFYDMYTPDVLLSDPTKVLYNGRPSFTKRELLDWDLNDIRSLLIVEKLKPEWGNQLPEILNPGPNLPKFKLQLLPLNSSDNFIISTLINSDLYMEANLDYEFKLTSAKYTVAAARARHEQMIGHHEVVMNLSKPEWRNIIENYLLNIAVEAQCRFDFKQRCSEYKRWKQQQQEEQERKRKQNLTKPNMPPPKTIPSKNSNLLKMTLMKNFNKIANTNNNINGNVINSNGIYPENMSGEVSRQDLVNSQAIKISLSQDEKANIWSQCQAQVYQRLGLDWKPDGLR